MVTFSDHLKPIREANLIEAMFLKWLVFLPLLVFRGQWRGMCRGLMDRIRMRTDAALGEMYNNYNRRFVNSRPLSFKKWG